MSTPVEDHRAPVWKPSALGRWFGDLPVGLVVHHAVTRTVTTADNVLFSTMTMNVQPLHLDEDFASRTEFGRPLINSLFTLGLVVGLSVTELTHGTTVANLGFTRADFPHPVFAGDTVRVISEVVDARPSKSRPGQGVVKFVHTGLNQRGEVICIAERAALMHGGPEGQG